MTAGEYPRVEIHPEAAWATAVAGALAARLREQPALRLCLPTGDTPVPVYELFVAMESRREVSLAETTVVMLDEWLGLPPGDPARCDARLRAQLVDALRVPPASFVPIDVDGAEADVAAARHDEAARGLDLVILGIGMNGHVGFNEPGSQPGDRTRVVDLAESSRRAAMERYGASAMPSGGITVGPARILEAGECWLLATGARKASILRRALGGPETPDCPASLLRRHPRLTVFADEAAAAMLSRADRPSQAR